MRINYRPALLLLATVFNFNSVAADTAPVHGSEEFIRMLGVRMAKNSETKEPIKLSDSEIQKLREAFPVLKKLSGDFAVKQDFWGAVTGSGTDSGKPIEVKWPWAERMLRAGWIKSVGQRHGGKTTMIATTGEVFVAQQERGNQLYDLMNEPSMKHIGIAFGTE